MPKRRRLVLPTIPRRKPKPAEAAPKPGRAKINHLAWIAPLILVFGAAGWFVIAPERTADHSQVVVATWTKDAMLLIASYPGYEAAETDLAKKLADSIASGDKRRLAGDHVNLGLLAALRRDSAAARREWTAAAKLYDETGNTVESTKVKTWISETLPPSERQPL